MTSALVIFSFILGTISGSFLNVASLRHGVKKISGRSRCPKCGHTLCWFELIPLVSYLLSLGKCRSCKIRISPRYFLVELIMGFLFTVIFLQSAHVVLAVLLVILLQLSLVLVLYDFKHLILPSEYLNTFLVMSIITGFVRGSLLFGFSPLRSLLFVVAGLVLVGLPLLALWFFSKGRWIGFGDVRLTFAMGALLGTSLGFSALIFSFWIGAGTMLLVLLVQKIWKGKLGMKSMIPFGPFLLLGTWLVIMFPIDLRVVHSLVASLLW